jgi:predicted O-methyltransferase YrrM
MTESESIVHGVLSRSFPGKEIRPQRAFTRAGMSPEELVRLYELVLQDGRRNVLEVGMGSGTSSIVMLTALERTQGRLTSIDPFQTSSFQLAGRNVVATAGHAERHRLIERPDYLALPELLSGGERFDMILVDGYHSFDYTLVDVFYADLLLLTDGILAVHDSSWPAVLPSLEFVRAHKPYAPVSPRPFIRHNDIIRKAVRRLGLLIGGAARLREFNDRRQNWHTLAVYRKLADGMAPEFDLAI